MKKALVVLVLSVVLGLSKVSFADCACNDWKKAFEAQLQAVEKQRYEAMTTNDAEKLKSILGDDLVYVHSNGDVQSKPDFMESLKNGGYKYNKITSEIQAARFYGETAVLNGRGTFDLTRTVEGKSQDVSRKMVFTAIYILRGEGLARHWELVSWQSSGVGN